MTTALRSRPTRAEVFRAKAFTEEQEIGLPFLRVVDDGLEQVALAFRAVLREAFERLGDSAATLYLIRAEKNRKVSEERRLVDGIVADLNLEREAELQFRPMYGATYRAAGQVVMQAYTQLLGVELSIGVRDAIAERMLREGGLRVGLLDLPQQTRDSLFIALEEARAAGLSIPDTARSIRSHVGAGRYINAGARYRAEVVARTEMRHARNVSTLETGRAAGFEWYVLYDNRLGTGDELCGPRDGQIVEYETAISLPEHPNGSLSYSPLPRDRPATVGGGAEDIPTFDIQDGGVSQSATTDWIMDRAEAASLRAASERLMLNPRLLDGIRTLEDAVARGLAQEYRAASMMNNVATGPKFAELHRGMSFTQQQADDFLLSVQEGQDFRTGMSSFSLDPSQARLFAHGEVNVYVIASDVRGYNLASAARGTYAEAQQEVIVAGQFRIKSITVRTRSAMNEEVRSIVLEIW